MASFETIGRAKPTDELLLGGNYTLTGEMDLAEPLPNTQYEDVLRGTVLVVDEVKKRVSPWDGKSLASNPRYILASDIHAKGASPSAKFKAVFYKTGSINQNWLIYPRGSVDDLSLKLHFEKHQIHLGENIKLPKKADYL